MENGLIDTDRSYLLQAGLHGNVFQFFLKPLIILYAIKLELSSYG